MALAERLSKPGKNLLASPTAKRATQAKSRISGAIQEDIRNAKQDDGPRLRVIDLFKNLEGDGDEEVSRIELKQAFLSLGVKITKQHLDLIFEDKVNEGSLGTISFGELATSLTSILPFLPRFQEWWPSDRLLWGVVEKINSGHQSAARLFSAMNADKDAAVSRRELVVAMTEMNLEPTVEEIEDLFLAIDVDHSGDISIEEFERAIALCEHRGEPPGIKKVDFWSTLEIDDKDFGEDDESEEEFKESQMVLTWNFTHPERYDLISSMDDLLIDIPLRLDAFARISELALVSEANKREMWIDSRLVNTLLKCVVCSSTDYEEAQLPYLSGRPREMQMWLQTIREATLMQRLSDEEWQTRRKQLAEQDKRRRLEVEARTAKYAELQEKKEKERKQIEQYLKAHEATMAKKHSNRRRTISVQPPEDQEKKEGEEGEELPPEVGLPEVGAKDEEEGALSKTKSKEKKKAKSPAKKPKGKAKGKAKSEPVDGRKSNAEADDAKKESRKFQGKKFKKAGPTAKGVIRKSAQLQQKEADELYKAGFLMKDLTLEEKEKISTRVKQIIRIRCKNLQPGPPPPLAEQIIVKIHALWVIVNLATAHTNKEDMWQHDRLRNSLLVCLRSRENYETGLVVEAFHTFRNLSSAPNLHEDMWSNRTLMEALIRGLQEDADEKLEVRAKAVGLLKNLSACKKIREAVWRDTRMQQALLSCAEAVPSKSTYHHLQLCRDEREQRRKEKLDSPAPDEAGNKRRTMASPGLSSEAVQKHMASKSTAILEIWAKAISTICNLSTADGNKNRMWSDARVRRVVFDAAGSRELLAKETRSSSYGTLKNLALADANRESMWKDSTVQTLLLEGVNNASDEVDVMHKALGTLGRLSLCGTNQEGIWQDVKMKEALLFAASPKAPSLEIRTAALAALQNLSFANANVVSMWQDENLRDAVLSEFDMQVEIPFSDGSFDRKSIAVLTERRRYTPKQVSFQHKMLSTIVNLSAESENQETMWNDERVQRMLMFLGGPCEWDFDTIFEQSDTAAAEDASPRDLESDSGGVGSVSMRAKVACAFMNLSHSHTNRERLWKDEGARDLLLGMARREPPLVEIPKVIHVHVRSAKGLRIRHPDDDMDAQGQEEDMTEDGWDVFCMVEAIGGSQLTKAVLKTEIEKGTLSPSWDLAGDLRGFEYGDAVKFTLYDKDSAGMTELLGEVCLSSDMFWPEGLEGEFSLSQAGFNNHHEPADAKLALKIDVPMTGVHGWQDAVMDRLCAEDYRVSPHRLSVRIISAKDLRAANLNKAQASSDPICVCRVVGKERTFKTKVCPDTLYPVWNHQGEFTCFSLGDTLEFTVFDFDLRGRNQFLGSAYLPGSGVLPTGFTGDLLLHNSMIKPSRGHKVATLQVVIQATVAARSPLAELSDTKERIGKFLSSGEDQSHSDASELGAAENEDGFDVEEIPIQRRGTLPPTRPDGVDAELEKSGDIEHETGAQDGSGGDGQGFLALQLRAPSDRLFAAQETEKEKKTLTISVLSATGLRDADKVGGKSDPYCTIEIQDGKGPLAKTKVKSNTNNPQWNENLILKGYGAGQAIVFKVWDKDKTKKDDYLGTATVTSDLFLKPGGSDIIELKLAKAGKGADATLKVKINALALEAENHEEAVEHVASKKVRSLMDTEEERLSSAAPRLILNIVGAQLNMNVAEEALDGNRRFVFNLKIPRTWDDYVVVREIIVVLADVMDLYWMQLKKLQRAVMVWNTKALRETIDECLYPEHARYDPAGVRCEFPRAAIREAENYLKRIEEARKSVQPIIDQQRVKIDFDTCAVESMNEIKFEARIPPDAAAKFSDGERAMEIFHDVAEIMNLFERKTVIEVYMKKITGAQAYVDQLTQNRANLVKEKLVAMGVQPDLLLIRIIPGFFPKFKIVFKPNEDREHTQSHAEEGGEIGGHSSLMFCVAQVPGRAETMVRTRSLPESDLTSGKLAWNLEEEILGFHFDDVIEFKIYDFAKDPAAASPEPDFQCSLPGWKLKSSDFDGELPLLFSGTEDDNERVLHVKAKARCGEWRQNFLDRRERHERISREKSQQLASLKECQLNALKALYNLACAQTNRARMLRHEHLLEVVLEASLPENNQEERKYGLELALRFIADPNTREFMWERRKTRKMMLRAADPLEPEHIRNYGLDALSYWVVDPVIRGHVWRSDPARQMLLDIAEEAEQSAEVRKIGLDTLALFVADTALRERVWRLERGRRILLDIVEAAVLPTDVRMYGIEALSNFAAVDATRKDMWEDMRTRSLTIQIAIDAAIPFDARRRALDACLHFIMDDEIRANFWNFETARDAMLGIILAKRGGRVAEPKVQQYGLQALVKFTATEALQTLVWEHRGAHEVLMQVSQMWSQPDVCVHAFVAWSHLSQSEDLKEAMWKSEHLVEICVALCQEASPQLDMARTYATSTLCNIGMCDSLRVPVWQEARVRATLLWAANAQTTLSLQMRSEAIALLENLASHPANQESMWRDAQFQIVLLQCGSVTRPEEGPVRKAAIASLRYLVEKGPNKESLQVEVWGHQAMRATILQAAALMHPLDVEVRKLAVNTILHLTHAASNKVPMWRHEATRELIYRAAESEFEELWDDGVKALKSICLASTVKMLVWRDPRAREALLSKAKTPENFLPEEQKLEIMLVEEGYSREAAKKLAVDGAKSSQQRRGGGRGRGRGVGRGAGATVGSVPVDKTEFAPFSPSAFSEAPLDD